MSRPLRLEFAGAFWHVTARGNEKKDIFRDDDDRTRFLALLAATVVRFGWRLHAWVLMSNHYHLLLQTPDPTLSRGMHWLNSQYAQGFNRRHKRVGHLFQGRFKGLLVDSRMYLLDAARYVVLNPVRAGIVQTADAWRWSSYRQTAGLDPLADWLSTEPLLAGFGAERGPAQQLYRSFVEAAPPERTPLWGKVVGQIYLGSDEWLTSLEAIINSRTLSGEHPREQLLRARPSMDDVLQAVAAVHDTTPESLRSAPSAVRSIAAYLAFEDGLIRLTEIAAALGLRGSPGASAAVRSCRNALPNDSDMGEIVHSCRSRMHRSIRTGGAPPVSLLLRLPRRHGSVRT